MAKTIRLKTPRLKPKFKYNINDQIDLLPRQFQVNDIVKHLAKSGITRNEFYRDRSIQFGNSKSIPSDRLITYAQLFDCDIKELMNHTIETQSLRGSINPSAKTSLK